MCVCVCVCVCVRARTRIWKTETDIVHCSGMWNKTWRQLDPMKNSCIIACTHYTLYNNVHVHACTCFPLRVWRWHFQGLASSCWWRCLPWSGCPLHQWHSLAQNQPSQLDSEMEKKTLKHWKHTCRKPWARKGISQIIKLPYIHVQIRIWTCAILPLKLIMKNSFQF